MAIRVKHFFKSHPHVCAFLLFVVAAIVLTYPLAFQFSTHILSNNDHEGDAPMFLWNMWWFKHAIFNLHQNPYHATTIMWPESPSLAFHTLAPVNAMLSLPFQYVCKPIVAFNITTLFIITLNGFCMYLLVWRFTRFRLGSVVAGMVFAYCPALTAWALGHYNLLAAWMLPLIVLLLFTIKDRIVLLRDAPIKDRRNLFAIGAMFGLLLGMQYWNDTYYFLYACIGVVIFATLFAKEFFITSTIKKAVAVFGLALVVCSISIFPLVRMQLRELSLHGSSDRISVGMYEVFSPDLLRYMIPSPLNGLLRTVPLTVTEKIPLHGNSQMYILPVYLSFSLLALAVIGTIAVIRRKEQFWNIRFWLAIIVVFFVISLGPTVFVADHAFARGLLPYAIFSKIPLFNNVRVPARAIIVVYLAFAALSSFALPFLLQKKSRWRVGLAVFLLACLAVEFFPLPRQTKNVAVPDIYGSLQTPSQGVIFEMPFGRANGLMSYGQYLATLQSYQTVHHRKILLGSISRIPEKTLSAVSEIAELQYMLHPTIAPLPDDSQTSYAVGRLRTMGISEIVLHTQYFPEEKAKEIERYLALFADSIVTSDNGSHRLYRLR